MTMSAIYRENFEALKRLPLFESLVDEINRVKDRNRVLKNRNKLLKEKNRALKNVIYTFPEVFRDRIVIENPVNIVIDKNSEQPTLCETVIDDDEDEVQIIAPEENENIVYDLTDENDNEETPPPRIIIKKEKNIIEDQVIDLVNTAGNPAVDPTVNEEEDPAVSEEAEDVEEEEEEDPAVSEEAEEETEEEEQAEEEEVEEEQAEEEEADEVFVITIKSKSYYTTNEKTGTIYAIDADEEVGAEVGVFVNGKAKFHKK